MIEIRIDRTWDGEPAREDEIARLRVSRGTDGLVVDVDAPFHDDPAPSPRPGRCDRLWDYEVVELFLIGKDERYLEVELGPHGHYLALLLHGVRNVVESGVELEFRTGVTGGRWTGTARIHARHVPEGLERWNAFAIHGTGDARRYLAAHPVRGNEPDFHRIDLFPRF